MASGSRLEADHRHLSLNFERCLGRKIKEDPPLAGKKGNRYVMRKETQDESELPYIARTTARDRSLRSRDRVHRAVDRSYEAARWNRGGSRRYRFAIHSLLASYDNEPCKDPRCHVCASPASSKGRGTRHGSWDVMRCWRPEAQVHRQKPWRVPAEPTAPCLYSQVYGCISTIRLRATC